MDSIQLDPGQGQSYEALEAFLQGCQAKAVAVGHPQLVSIAAKANALDPLAVLESIYEAAQPHFYVERRRGGLAVAGAEEAIRFEEGSNCRFESAKAWMREVLDNTIAVGDSTLPFFGPCFFCGFTFSDTSTNARPFPASSVFVPRWQVSVVGSRCVAIANALVGAGDDVASVARRIWNANTKFRGFDYAADEGRHARERLRVLETVECGGETRFKASVAQALELIREGEFQKIVLARALDLKADQRFHPLEILNTLRERYDDCYAFSIANGKGQSLIGASPECLVSVSNGQLQVDVLAGTAPRGKTASEDAKLGHALLNSEKDRREHRIVFESICRRLEGLGISIEARCEPTLKRLQNVQHLHVEIKAKVDDGIHILDAVSALHPTPAVGGNPRDKALPHIRDLEAFERDLYAGPVGWVDAKGEGEFLVAIRCAMVDGERARLYAGVGIVEGSDPQKELEETDLKFKALLENLL